MSKRSLQSLFAGISVLVLAVLACGGGTAPTGVLPTTQAPAPTSAVAPTAKATPSGTLDLVSSYGYKDSAGDYHVVGLIHNGTPDTLDSIELTLALKNVSGKTMLRDNNSQPAQSVKFSPALDTLAPGEESPFDYYVNTADVGEAAPNGFKVTITGHQSTQVKRAAVTVENVQMVSDASGSIYVTGEIRNQDKQAAQLASYAAAALDDAGHIVAENDTGSLTRLLAPAGDSAGNDRTPFSFRLDSPGDVARSAAVYLDAVQPDSYAPASVQVQVSNTYFDENKNYHIVGTMTNNDKDTLTVRLVAGLYTKDGVPLDADTVDSTFDLATGQSVPFDFQSFSSVGGLPAVAARLDHYTVQVDPYWTFAANATAVSLQTAADKKVDNGSGHWEFTGSVTNSSGKELTTASVVVAVYDAQNKLVAVGSSGVTYQGSNFAVNAQGTYDAPVDLDPSVDASSFTFKTFAQGIEK